MSRSSDTYQPARAGALVLSALSFALGSILWLGPALGNPHGNRFTSLAGAAGLLAVFVSPLLFVFGHLHIDSLVPHRGRLATFLTSVLSGCAFGIAYLGLSILLIVVGEALVMSATDTSWRGVCFFILALYAVTGPFLAASLVGNLHALARRGP